MLAGEAPWWTVAYLAVGVVVAITYLLFLGTRVDSSISGSSWLFRLVVFPASVVLWPILLRQLVRRGNKPS